MRTVAVDAMGGDHAPGPEVEGAVAAVRERLARVILVGDEARLKEELRKHSAEGLEGIVVKHASEVIRMEDHPAVAADLRREPGGIGSAVEDPLEVGDRDQWLPRQADDRVARAHPGPVGGGAGGDATRRRHLLRVHRQAQDGRVGVGEQDVIGDRLAA